MCVGHVQCVWLLMVLPRGDIIMIIGEQKKRGKLMDFGYSHYVKTWKWIIVCEQTQQEREKSPVLYTFPVIPTVPLYRPTCMLIY